MGTVSIPLTQGKTAIIDEDDYPLIAGIRWHAVRCRKNWYASGHTRIDGRGKSVYMHRVILGNPRGDVDHWDGDGLNNRRANLRTCSRAQNIANQRLPVTNRSGYRGVSWRKRDRKWYAYIKINRKTKNLGGFLDAREAGMAYDDAARAAFGEFARLNFPRKGEAPA